MLFAAVSAGLLVSCGEDEAATPDPISAPAEYEEGLAELTPSAEQRRLRRQLEFYLPVDSKSEDLVRERFERSYRALGRLWEAAAREQGELAERLRELEPPSELAEAHQTYLAFVERSVERFSSVGEGVRAADSPSEARAEFAAMNEFFADERNRQAASALSTALSDYGYSLPPFLANQGSSARGR